MHTPLLGRIDFASEHALAKRRKKAEKQKKKLYKTRKKKSALRDLMMTSSRNVCSGPSLKVR